MQSATKKALGPSWQDAGITRITDHAPTGKNMDQHIVAMWLIRTPQG